MNQSANSSDQQHRHLLIIGAQKSGTTALHRFLSMHPKIEMSIPKETNFFVNRQHRDYLDYFPDIEGKEWLGEASPIYMLRCQQVAPRIAASLKKAKLIACLRNPIERTYSQFHMLIQNGKANCSFEQALTEAQSINCIENISFEPISGYPTHPIHTLLQFSNYASQLRCYFDHFKPDQLLLLRHEQLRDQQDEALADIFNFLGLETVKIDSQQIHKRKYPAMEFTLWQRVLHLLEPQIEQLEILLNWDLSQWKKYPESLYSSR